MNVQIARPCTTNRRDSHMRTSLQPPDLPVRTLTGNDPSRIKTVAASPKCRFTTPAWASSFPAAGKASQAASWCVTLLRRTRHRADCSRNAAESPASSESRVGSLRQHPFSPREPSSESVIRCNKSFNLPQSSCCFHKSRLPTKKKRNFFLGAFQRLAAMRERLIVSAPRHPQVPKNPSRAAPRSSTRLEPGRSCLTFLASANYSAEAAPASTGPFDLRPKYST